MNPPALDRPEAEAATAAFLDAMSDLASGVALVTTWIESRPWGLTVTAFTSVSAAPPTILVSLRSNTRSAEAIAAGAGFGVAVLAPEHEPLARRASARGAPKFLEPFAHAAPWSSSPVIRGSLAHFDCEPAGSVDVADHTVFFGRVRAAAASGGGTPLVYFRRTFGTHAPHRTARRTR
jgi:flavin reductase (DIM6/NTAB) family NADH-FMN oxidoreductase RutF